MTDKDNFKALNRRDRRRSDQWAYKLQWIVGTLAGICILSTVIAQVLHHVH